MVRGKKIRGPFLKDGERYFQTIGYNHDKLVIHKQWEVRERQRPRLRRTGCHARKHGAGGSGHRGRGQAGRGTQLQRNDSASG